MEGRDGGKRKEPIVVSQNRVKVPPSLWCSAKLNCVRHESPTTHTLPQNTERKRLSGSSGGRDHIRQQSSSWGSRRQKDHSTSYPSSSVGWQEKPGTGSKH